MVCSCRPERQPRMSLELKQRLQRVVEARAWEAPQYSARALWVGFRSITGEYR